MGRAMRWLWGHPLVWLIPLVFWASLALFAIVRLGDAPETEFIYDVRG